MDTGSGFHRLLENDGRKLTKKNGRNAMALCWAHDDKKPSLSVDDRGLWLCFSCGAKGNAYQYLTVHQGIDKKGALDRLEKEGLHERKPPRTDLPADFMRQHSYFDAEGQELGRIYVHASPRGKRISQWSACPSSSSGWAAEQMPEPIWYRLPQLAEADPVLIVEGEKCADAIAGVGLKGGVTTWPGGAVASKGSNLARIPLDPLAGKAVMLWPDNDDPGKKAMEFLAARLQGVAASIGLIDVPQERPAKWDAADFIDGGAGAEEVRDFISRFGAPWAKPAAAAPEPTIPRERLSDPPDLSPIGDNPHFRILGTRGDFLVCQRKKTGSLIDLANSALNRAGAYSQIAPKRWWEALISSPRITGAWREELTDALTRLAIERGVFDYGRVVERGVFFAKDGHPIIHLGDRLHDPADGRQYDLGHVADPIFKEAPPIPLPKRTKKGRAMLADLSAALQGYRFEGAGDRLAFFGWMVAALIGGALPWRPHLWILGESGSGKSWLLREVVHKIFGEWSENIGKTTIAGLTRTIGSSGLPQLLDEAELTEGSQTGFWRDFSLILRLASDGVGAIIKADTGTQTSVVRTRPRCCFLLSSISIPRRQRADESRCTCVRLKSESLPAPEWAEVEKSIRRAMRNAEAIRAEIVFNAPGIVGQIKEAHALLIARGFETRASDQMSAIAGAASWGADLPIEHVLEALEAGRDLRGAMSEQHALLSDLMAAEITIDGRDRFTTTVASALTSFATQDAIEALARHGIRWDDCGGDHLLIAATARGLLKLLRSTRFANADLRHLLQRVDGAIADTGQRRFGAQRFRGVVLIPKDKLPL